MKIVFFDADGTLCHLVKGMPSGTADAVRGLAEAGIHTVLCTGRSGPMVGAALHALPFSGQITSNGSCIRIGEFRKEWLLPVETVQEILQLTKDTEVHPILCGESICLYDPERMTEAVDPWLPYTIPSVKDHFIPLSDYDVAMPVNKICIKSNQTEAEMAILQQLEGHMLLDYGCNPEKPGTMEAEVYPNGCSKGSAIARYLKLLSEITGEDPMTWETWAVGDGSNDVAMFEAVTHSIAMGNASERVKKAAEFVTDDLWHDGVALACRRILRSDNDTEN